MKWPGIENSGSELGGDSPTDATGISYFIDEEVRRRPGLTQLSATGGIALGAFRSPLNGAWILVVKSNGDVVSVSL